MNIEFITEEQLKEAALLLQKSMLDSLPAKSELQVEFSDEFEESMQPLVHRMHRSYKIHKVLERVAVWALIVTMCFSSWLAVDTDARAAFFSWTKEVYENSFAYRFFTKHTTNLVKTADYLPTYLPQGYQEIESHIADDLTVRTYENESQDQIVFMCMDTNDRDLFVLQNEKEAESVQIGTNVGDYYQYETEANELIWVSEDQTAAFYLGANLPKEEMIKIAEKVHKK